MGCIPVTDPGFSPGGVLTPKNLLFLIFWCILPWKIFGPQGACVPGSPTLGPPMHTSGMGWGWGGRLHTSGVEASFCNTDGCTPLIHTPQMHPLPDTTQMGASVGYTALDATKMDAVPPPDAPLLCEQNDTRLWKHYLPHTSYGKNLERVQKSFFH